MVGILRELRELLDAYGFEKCRAKAVQCSEYSGIPSADMIQRM